MASTGVPADTPVRYFQAGDGVQLAYREMGEGRPLVLIHGYFSTAVVNWMRYGHAAILVAFDRLELEAGQTRCYAHEVGQHCPGFLDRGAHRELVRQLHAVSSS